VFDFKQLKTIKNPNGQLSRHMTDGETDITLTVDGKGAAVDGCLGSLRRGLEVANRKEFATEIVTRGGTLLSNP
jgi:hypothetical protein